MSEGNDKELEQYRNLMQVPSTFGEGFSLASFVGVLFIAVVMVPGAMYMELLAGGGSIGPAAQWVTLILFIEVAKRAHAKLTRPQLFVLFYMAGAIMSQGIASTPLWNQFLARSDAAVASGLASEFPPWVVPPDPAAYDHRTFLQLAWLPALGLMVFQQFFSRLGNVVLGYGLFRLASDIERLPFPFAPIQAQGTMALADDLEGSETAEESWRWRVFSIGGALGMGFGLFYYALPTLTGAIFNSTWTIFPIPFVEWSDYTKDWLPAVATGLSFDLGLVILGMVMPYYAMVGAFLGLIATMIANPILYHYGVLSSWSPGDKTVEIMFKNSVDFYFSFGIGLSLAVAGIGILSLLRLRKKPVPGAAPGAAEPVRTPPGRGDIPWWGVGACYFVTTLAYILVCGWLIDWHRGVMVVLILLGVVYTPLMSYVTARLEGIAGQVVEIPFVTQLGFILSGYHGVAVWFLPVPVANYGVQTVLYRAAELTGTKFTSLWKAEAALFPVMIIAIIGFGSFIWGLAEIPSSVYPYTQQMWELNARNQMLMISSTSGEYSHFTAALSGPKVGTGIAVGGVLFGLLSVFDAPVTLVYGLIRGIGSTLPHTVIPQFLGALLGRYYFERRMGMKWREYVPVLSAGFFCGGGLVTMFCIGVVFLSKSANHLPY
jgi:hypothetical protein